MSKEPLRWILHLDMDAFFAAVEQLDNPEYRGKPLIIGGAERGVVSTASYEARVFGVHSAMPMFQARRLCPHGIFIPGRRTRYAEKSAEVMAVAQRFSPLVEQASIDEAYLDLTGLEHIFGSVEETARALQAAISEETGLTGSVGIAPVKFLAKIASDMRKPSGLTIITHEAVPAFLEKLPIGKIPGVGPQTLRILESCSIRTAADAARYPESFWQRRLGKFGSILHARAQGIDPRPVEPDIEAKSESAENTFAEDTRDREILSAWLLRQSERVGASLRKRGQAGRTVTLKVKYADFSQKTRSRTLQRPTNTTRVIYETALALLTELRLDGPLRLIGVGVSQFGAKEEQFSLLSEQPSERPGKDAALDAALDAARDKFGRNAVIRGKLFQKSPSEPGREGKKEK